MTSIKRDLSSEPWLLAPIGDTKKIGEEFCRLLAAKENLEIVVNLPDSRLLNK